MENQDKLYEQFQQASQKAEAKDFPAMDKVWARVEEKLEQKALKKESTTWKKIAIAASFLLLMTLGYHFLQNEAPIEVTTPHQQMATPEKQEKIIPVDSVKKDAVVISEERHPLIKKDAEKIIQEKVSQQQSVALEEVQATQADVLQQEDATETLSNSIGAKKKTSFATPKFDAISVKRNALEPHSIQKEEAVTVVQEKSSPLIILDGKALKHKDSASEDYLKNQADYETLTILPNPLYIINGVQYTEQELFGPNPTSPYHPLTKQEILSTSILQGESATNLYGEKGKNGVVIITTKNGKPLKQ